MTERVHGSTPSAHTAGISISLENGLCMQLKDLRLLLRSAAHSEDGASLFKWLYRSWCHSLGAVLSLCFLSEVPASPPQWCLQHDLTHCMCSALYPAITRAEHILQMMCSLDASKLEAAGLMLRPAHMHVCIPWAARSYLN